MGIALHRTTGTTGIRKIRFHDATHAIQLIKHGFVRTGAGLKRFYSSFSASLSRSFVFGGGYGATTITTATVTATAVGGYGTLTHAWTHVSGDTFTIVSPASASTSFRRTVAPGALYSGVYTCDVTDATGQTVNAGNVSVTISNNSSTA